MDTDQREPRHVMLEANFTTPGVLIVTVSTGLTLLARVNITVTVTVDTPVTEILLTEFAAMAGAAQKFRMPSPERKTGFPIVIETCLLPSKGSMTGITPLAIAPLVLVITAMTGNTGSPQLLVEQAAAMAGITADPCMFPGQWIIGTAVVVEYDSIPRRFPMTVIALFPVSAGMDVIQSVTVKAPCRRAFVALPCMAAVAVNLPMSATQPEIRLVMIKCLLHPATRIMAIPAGFPQIFLVDIIVGVTVNACVSRFPIFRSCLVT